MPVRLACRHPLTGEAEPLPHTQRAVPIRLGRAYLSKKEETASCLPVSPRLHSAVLYRQEDKIREYVEAGDDVNATYNGQTCLHFLVYSGAFAGGKDKAEASEDVDDIARLVISLGGDVNARDGWGQTPIVWPAQYGTDAPYGYDLVELTNVYVQNGADLENCDKWGYRPIHGCAAAGQLQTLRAIITGGADTCSCAAGTKGGVNVTPLMSAIQNKQSQSAMMLLQCGGG